MFSLLPFRPDYKAHLPILLKWEGGDPFSKSLSDRQKGWNVWDSAGATQFGITLALWNALAEKGGWKPGKDTLYWMTSDQYLFVVKDNWNKATNKNAINSTAVACVFADSLWAAGNGGLFWLQRGLNELAKTQQLLPITVDGVVGPLTTGLANALISKLGEQKVAERMMQGYSDLYEVGSVNNPNYTVSITGWRNRIAFVRKYIPTLYGALVFPKVVSQLIVIAFLSSIFF
jgi:lysozyme family protein